MLPVEPASTYEPAENAPEVGEVVFSGPLGHLSDAGGWQSGHVDLSEYVDRYRNRLVLVIAPVGPRPEMGGAGEVAWGHDVTLRSICCGTERTVTRADAANDSSQVRNASEHKRRSCERHSVCSPTSC